MKHKVMYTALVFSFACAINANSAFAGAADMKTTDGSQMKFEYDGDNMRINTGQEGSYMIINGDGMYVINNSGGQLMVIDAGKMMGMFGDMASTSPSMASSKIISLEATGTREDLAGIKGEVYNLEYVDEESGDVHATTLVLSSDSRAIELTRAMTGMASAMVTAAGKSSEGANELQEYMASLDKGVLRYGQDMWVTAISDRAIASERFVLPAEPKDLSGMSGIADAINNASTTQASSSGSAGQSAEQPKKKGLVSGFLSAFSKKADDQAERQQDRVEDKANDAVDDAADEAVDNVFDKALGKLFGD